MTRSLIAAGLSVVGDLKCRSDVLVEGRFEGNLEARDLVIAEGAIVEGSVMARTVRIEGTLSGNLGAGNVTVGRSGRLVGEMLYQNLVIERGAWVEANIQNLRGHDSESEDAADAREDSADVEIPEPGDPRLARGHKRRKRRDA